MIQKNENGAAGRVLGHIAGRIRAAILAGKHPVGELLPSVRQISRTLGVSSKTAHRALQALAAQGILAAEPCRGFRVTRRPEGPGQGCIVAYALETRAAPEAWNDLHRVLLASLQAASHVRGWSLLSLSTQGRPVADVMATLRSAHVFGIALDLTDPDLIRAVRQAGLPAVMVDCGVENAGVDVLMQDGQMGGMQAVQDLVARGCRRIAWVGNTRATAHSKDRLSGALIGLHCAGRRGFTPATLVDLDGHNPDHIEDPAAIAALVGRILSRKDRPDGIVALWMGYAHIVARVAVELGLLLGRDLHVVSWCAEELYETSYRPGFAPGPVPPAVIWSARTMSETAVARLAERRENPTLPPLRIKIPTRLAVGEQPETNP